MLINGDTATLHSPSEGDNTFVRVIASHQPGTTGTNTAPSFSAGGSGKITTDFGGNDFGVSVMLQTDGKILAEGSAQVANNSEFALARYNANGSLDTSFDSDGKVTTDMGGSDGGNATALQADGKILVAGEVYTGSDTYFGLARYNLNGGLDTSFAGSGKLTTDFGGSGNEKANSVMLQADGKILAAGSYSISNSTSSGGGFALARYNTDGSLDTAFDGDGKVTTSFGDDGNGYGIALQADGKILVVGSSHIGGVDKNDFTLARYNTNGSLDTSFDSDGKLTTDFGGAEYGMSASLQADGKILVAGTSYIGSNNFALARYNADGSLDTSFDGDGKVSTDFGSSDNGFSIALQADGKILVAGTSNADFALACYNTDGSLDTSFDGDGKLTTDFGGTDEGYSIKLQADGKILVAGTRTIGGSGDFALARYNPDGSLDTSFGSGGSNTLNDAPSYTENAAAVVLDGSVQIVDTELAALGNYAGATLTLSRHGGANAEDSFAASGSLGNLSQGGNLVYAGTTIGTVSTNGSGTLLLTFNSSATQTLVNSALSAIAYANSSDAPSSSVQIDWSFSDGNTGSQGSGGALAASGSTTVSITATNDAPLNTVPGAQTVNSNSNLNLGQTVSLTVAGVSVADADAGTLQATLSAAHGVLSLATTSGLSFTTGDGNADASLVFSGSKASVNAALNNLTYQPTGGYSGTDTISLTSSDLGGSGTGGTLTDSDTITVNVIGGTANQNVTGGVGNDNLTGGAGNETLTGGAGNDTLDGGSGIDSAVYSGTRAHYAVAKTAAGYTVKDNVGTDGIDTVVNIERLNFSDSTIALTMEGVNSGTDATAAYNVLSEKLYVAYFGRPADSGGFQSMTSQLSAAHAPTSMQAFIDSYNTNATVKAIIDGFGNSPESGRLYTGSNADFVAAIFQNLFGRNPAGTFWSDALDNHQMSRSQAAMNIMAGAEVNTTAQGMIDAAAIANKIVVADNFTTAIVASGGYSGSTAAASARTMLHSVNQDTNVFDYQTSVESTLNAMGARMPHAQAFSPASGQDIASVASLIGISGWSENSGTGQPHL